MDKYLFKTWDAAVVLIDKSATIRFANDAATDAFGYSRNNMEGMPARALVPPDVRERTTWYQILNPSGDQYAAGVLVRCLHSDGHFFNAAVTVYPVDEAMPDGMWVMIDAVGSNTSPNMNQSLSGLHEPEVAQADEQDNGGSWLETRQRLNRSFERLALDLRSIVMADVFGVVALDLEASTVHLCHRKAFLSDKCFGPRNVGDSYGMSGTIAAEISAHGSPVVVTADSAESFQKLYPGVVPADSPCPYLSSIAVMQPGAGSIKGILFAHSIRREAFGQEHVEYLMNAPAIG